MFSESSLKRISSRLLPASFGSTRIQVSQKFYATQARDAAPHYQHTHIGYNYRMSNICAGIGRGQMYVLEDHIARRRAIHSLYVDLLKDVAGITVMENPDSRFASNFWLTCILVDPKLAGKSREDIRLRLDSVNTG